MRKALVIGINQYPDAPLKGCVRDATDIGHMLARHADHTLNFEVKLETDLQHKSKLVQLAEALFRDKNEVALFYFSGHGQLNTLGGFLVTPDHRRLAEGVPMNDIITLANRSPATHKIIILDCCHSGAMAVPELVPGGMGHINDGVTVLAASRQEEVAIEVNGKGVFTNLLLEALGGGAADLNGNISPAGVYSFIDQALGPWDQRPVFKTNVSRFIALRRTEPRLSLAALHRLVTLFPDPAAALALDPSYEYTNDPGYQLQLVPPYADAAHVAVFRDLQQMQAAGLVEPVSEAHMYWAAMNHKSCRLTPLGAHYRRLVGTGKL